MAGNVENQQIEICEVQEVTDELVESFARLIPQLTKTKPVPNEEVLKEVVSSPNTVLIIARDSESNNKIVGTLTLVFFRTPVAMRSRIEDVVVDKDSRGNGIGEALINYAISSATQSCSVSVDLTSRPDREVANRLYRRIGFEKHLTNVYRYQLT